MNIQHFTLKKKLFLMSLGICLFIVLEGMARLFYSEDLFDQIAHVIKEDEQLIWAQREYLDISFMGKQVMTNDMGLRTGSMFAPRSSGTDPESEFKILNLGPSATFGWGVGAEEAYSGIMEKRLRDLARDQGLNENITVLNGGVIGYSSCQGAALFARLVDKISPDMITIAYGINDLERYRFYMNSSLNDLNLIQQKSSFFRMITVKMRNFFRNFHTFKFLERLTRVRISSQKAHEDKVRLEPRVPLAKYETCMGDFVKIAKNRGIRILFLNIPVGKTGQEDWRYREYVDQVDRYHEATRKIGRANDIPVIDMSNHFKTQGHLFMEDVGDIIHPNPKGHSLIANAIVDFIMTNSWIR